MFNRKQVISAIGAFVLATASASAEDFGSFSIGQGALDAIGSIKKESKTLQKKKGSSCSRVGKNSMKDGVLSTETGLF